MRRVKWDEVHPLDDSRGSHQMGRDSWEPTPLVVCRGFGHEESIGVFAASAPENENPEAVAAAMDRAELDCRRRGLIALQNLDLPVYVAEGRPGRLVGWGSHGRGKTSSVSVDHGG
ncbi:MAG: hypothetical protein QOF69_2428, partial [Solirubrobacteraceae bacterium]|nr:hypothetical protein [Solirubrobacteraceae bacterium]